MECNGKYILAIFILVLPLSCLSVSQSPVGVWKCDGGSKIIFYGDHTFDEYLKMDETEVWHRKGKWILSDDGGIFLRYFGSAHWPSEEDYKDYKINWADYYIIQNDQIIDNQEDYVEYSYIKEKE